MLQIPNLRSRPDVAIGCRFLEFFEVFPSLISFGIEAINRFLRSLLFQFFDLSGSEYLTSFNSFGNDRLNVRLCFYYFVQSGTRKFDKFVKLFNAFVSLDGAICGPLIDMWKASCKPTSEPTFVSIKPKEILSKFQLSADLKNSIPLNTLDVLRMLLDLLFDIRDVFNIRLQWHDVHDAFSPYRSGRSSWREMPDTLSISRTRSAGTRFKSTWRCV